MPLLIVWRISAPSSVPETLPQPPERLTPPRTTEAMTSMSLPMPQVGSATPTCEASRMPPSAPATEQ